jgi:hypothetical protein
LETKVGRRTGMSLYTILFFLDFLSGKSPMCIYPFQY